MSTQPGNLDSLQDTDHLLYVSLLILGLDPVALEHKLKTPVNQKCFSRINRKLGDAILHFLFVCLDREKAGKIFRDCWPLLDKKHESQFYKAAFEWYKTLQQSYRQPVPTVMTKTFMAPGGPRFTSTLWILARTALHTLITKRGSSCTLLHIPTHSRSREQNLQTLRVLQALKVSHSLNYIAQQKICERVLVTIKNKARELCGNYRRLCKEGERSAGDFIEALNNNERLTHHQRDIFTSASPATIRKAVFGDISRMNDAVSKLWILVDHYQQIEESAWKVLCPLLDGSTSLTHINGSVYSPQIPEMVYKTHANAINKLKLQGMYHEGKLDLLSLVQYSNLALTSLLDSSRNTYTHVHTESSDIIRAQSGQVISLGETVNQLNENLNALLPTFNQSFSSSFLNTSSLPTLERIGLEGKPQLCPPTPPFTLLGKPVPLISAIHVPLQLTPGVQEYLPRLAKDDFDTTPRRLLCDMGMIYASKKSPKPNVMYSTIAHKDDFINVNENIKEDISEEGLTMEMVNVDLQGQCHKKKERALLSDGHTTYKKSIGMDHSTSKRYFTKNLIEKEVITPIKVSNMNELDKEKRTQDHMKCTIDTAESAENSSIDQLANHIAEELIQCDDTRSKEILNSQTWNETEWKNSALESECPETAEDFDALSDAIQDMNVTRKWEKLDRSQNSSQNIDLQIDSREAAIQLEERSQRFVLPMYTPNKQNESHSGQHSQLANVSVIPLNFGCNNNFEQNIYSSPKTQCTGHKKVTETSPFDQRSYATSEKRKGSALRIERRWHGSIPDLQKRLHYINQTPVKNKWSTVGTKIPSRFDGLDVSPQSKCFTSRLPSDCSMNYENRNQGELGYHSKASLDFLLKLQNSSQKFNVLLQENPQVTSSKPSFISYVENLKKSHTLYTSELDDKTERHNEQETSNGTNVECIAPDTYANGWPSETVSNDFYENFARMQSLLDLDEDTTIIDVKSKHTKDWLQQDEVFISVADAGKQFETRRQSSSLLPEASVFDTLTDSILGGELDVSMLTDENVGKQIRRESLSSRRQSVANMRRLSLESTKYPLQAPRFVSEDCAGISDENDYCLLSTSLEDIMSP